VARAASEACVPDDDAGPADPGGFGIRLPNPLREPVAAPLVRVVIHDHLADEAQRHRLRSQNDQENPQQQDRAVGEGFSLQALHREDGEHEESHEGRRAAHEPEEAEGLVGEPQQEKHPEQVEGTPQVHARRVDARLAVLGVLGGFDLDDVETLALREEREEPEEIPIEGRILDDLPPHRPHAAREVAEARPAQPAHDAVEDHVLDAVDP
jgi:hypothetical protein